MKYINLLYFVLICSLKAAEQNNNFYGLLSQEEIAISFELFKFSKCLWSANFEFIQLTDQQAQELEKTKLPTPEFQKALGASLSDLVKDNTLKALANKGKFTHKSKQTYSSTSIYVLNGIASFLIVRQNFGIDEYNNKILGPKFNYLATVKTIPFWIKLLSLKQKICIWKLNKLLEENKTASDDFLKELKSNFNPQDFEKINLAFGLNYKYSWAETCVIS